MKTFSGRKFNEIYKAYHQPGCNGIVLEWVCIKDRMSIYPFFCVCKLGRKAKKESETTGLFAPFNTHSEIQFIGELDRQGVAHTGKVAYGLKNHLNK